MISFIVNLENILQNSGAEWEIEYVPGDGSYILRLNDEAVRITKMEAQNDQN